MGRHLYSWRKWSWRHLWRPVIVWTLWTNENIFFSDWHSNAVPWRLTHWQLSGLLHVSFSTQWRCIQVPVSNVLIYTTLAEAHTSFPTQWRRIPVSVTHILIYRILAAAHMSFPMQWRHIPYSVTHVLTLQHWQLSSPLHLSFPTQWRWIPVPVTNVLIFTTLTAVQTRSPVVSNAMKTYSNIGSCPYGVTNAMKTYSSSSDTCTYIYNIGSCPNVVCNAVKTYYTSSNSFTHVYNNLWRRFWRNKEVHLSRFIKTT